MVNSTSARRFAGFVLATLLCTAAPSAAQIDTASVVGTVRDSSGAVLPGVTVTATHDATAIATSVVTNSAGQFVFPGVRVGKYEIYGVG